MSAPDDLGGGGFVAFLKSAMKAAKIPTGARLAELADLNPSLVNRWLNGKTLPSIENLRSIAAPLGLEPRELWVRAGYMSRAEVGLGNEPTPLTGNHTLEDELRSDPRIRDDRKEPLIQFLKTLFEEGPESGSDARDEHTA